MKTILSIALLTALLLFTGCEAPPPLTHSSALSSNAVSSSSPSSSSSSSLSSSSEPPPRVKHGTEGARALEAVSMLTRETAFHAPASGGFNTVVTVLGNGYTIVQLRPTHLFGIYIYNDDTGTAEKMSIDSEFSDLTFAADRENSSLIQFSSASNIKTTSSGVSFTAPPATYTYDVNSRRAVKVLRNILEINGQTDFGIGANELVFGDLTGDNSGISIIFKANVNTVSEPDDLLFPKIHCYTQLPDKPNTITLEFENVIYDENVQKKMELLKNLAAVQNVTVLSYKNQQSYLSTNLWGTSVTIEFEPDTICQVDAPIHAETGNPFFQLLFKQ